MAFRWVSSELYLIKALIVLTSGCRVPAILKSSCSLAILILSASGSVMALLLALLLGRPFRHSRCMSWGSKCISLQLGEQQFEYSDAHISHCTNNRLHVAIWQLVIRSFGTPHCIQLLTRPLKCVPPDGHRKRSLTYIYSLDLGFHLPGISMIPPCS